MMLVALISSNAPQRRRLHEATSARKRDDAISGLVKDWVVFSGYVLAFPTSEHLPV